MRAPARLLATTVRRLTRPRVVIAATVCLLACGAAGVGMATHVRQAALARRSAYSITWATSQAATEAGRVVEQASAALAGVDDVDADDVRLRFDVLRNRIGVLDAAGYADFIAADPDAATAARAFRSAVSRAEALAGGLDRREGLVAFRSALAPALGPASVLAGAAHRFGIGQADADRRGLSVLYDLFCILVGAAGVGLVALVATVRRQRAELLRLAHHDALTGLANRARLATVMAERLRPVDPGRTDVAVLCLDLDRFKAVNDTHGHAVGDALLVAVARRLVALAAGADVVARVGGDEFLVVTTEGRAEALAAQIVGVLSRPFDVAGLRLTIGTSVGVALASRDGATADGLTKAADAALYRAKRSGAGWLASSEDVRGRAACAA